MWSWLKRKWRDFWNGYMLRQLVRKLAAGEKVQIFLTLGNVPDEDRDKLFAAVLKLANCYGDYELELVGSKGKWQVYDLVEVKDWPHPVT